MNDGNRSRISAMNVPIYILTTQMGYFCRYSDGLRAGRTGNDSRQRQEICPFSAAFIQALGPIQPRILWVSTALSPGLKRPGREADHSPPSSIEVKNDGAIPHFTYVCMEWCLINHRDSATHVLCDCEAIVTRASTSSNQVIIMTPP
jgi:hypothetical protein